MMNGTVHIRPGSVEFADAVISGPPKTILALLAGELNLTRARAEGLQYEGDLEILRRVQPLAVDRG